MSCLCISELPAAEQIAIYRASVEKTMRWLDSLSMPADAGETTPCAESAEAGAFPEEMTA